MNKALLTLVLAATCWPFASGATISSGCRASLSVTDARTLAAATPNARAFVDDFGATLQTAVRSQTGSTAVVAVTARDPKHGVTEVGTYSVSLRTGQVMDDDMEPAEDSRTASIRSKLMARHCAAR